MNFSLTWLPEVLEAAGLKVALVPGWEGRGRADMPDAAGVICHMTVGARNGNMPSLQVLIEGRSDLPGPLSQLGLGRDGTYYVIAAGRCNHAGAGTWQGIEFGNTRFIGIEAENTGRADDKWPAVQMDAYKRGVAAILRRLGRTAELCAGHKEYALPKGRKSDPNFDMEDFRVGVAAWLAPGAPAPTLIPINEPVQMGGRRTLRRDDAGELVERLQAKIGAVVDGNFGPRTEAAVREFQRRHDLVPDGIVGPKTWAAIGET